MTTLSRYQASGFRMAVTRRGSESLIFSKLPETMLANPEVFLEQY